MWFTFKHIFALIAALWIGFASGQTLYGRFDEDEGNRFFGHKV